MLLRVAQGWLFSVYIPNNISINPCVEAVVFLLCFYSHSSSSEMWRAFFLISPSALFWIIALLLVAKLITCDPLTVFQSLCTMFSWLCSFHSTSVHGGPSSSYRNQAVQSLERNSVPSPSYTTICSAIPQSRDTPSFSNFLIWLVLCFFLKSAIHSSEVGCMAPPSEEHLWCSQNLSLRKGKSSRV